MNTTGFQTSKSVDYRRNESEAPTAVTVFRVTYTVPLESTVHADFGDEVAVAGQLLSLLAHIRQTRRGVVTVTVL